MDRTHSQPGWLVLLAALSEVATAAPSRADAGLFDFDGAWLSEQNAEVDSGLLDGARRLRLDGLQTGSPRLSLDLRKAAPPPDPLRRFRYTVADARKEWLRSLASTQPNRLSLSGSVDGGAARGLSFQVTRNDGGRDAAVESRLAFSRAGFSADIHLRNVGGHFARSTLMSDDEWDRLKNIVGWRQSDMRFQWKAMPGLSLASEMSKGTKSDTGESRKRRRLSLDWAPGKASHLTLYHEVNTVGNKAGGSRATTRGFAWNQTVGGLAFGLAQEDARAAPGKSSRKRTLSLATRDKARTGFSYTRTDTRKESSATSVQALNFHARPSDDLTLAADYTLNTGRGRTRANRGLHLLWKPTDRWSFDGRWRKDAAAAGTMADFHLSGNPDKQTRLDARIQRITDPKSRYRKQDTLRLERKPRKGLQWSMQYEAVQLKGGASAKILEAGASLETPLGILRTAWRDGDADVLPGYADMTFTTGKEKGNRLSLTAHLRRREGAANTQTLDLTWKASDRLTLRAAYQRNPEDRNGQMSDLDDGRIAMAYDVSNRLRLNVSHDLKSAPRGGSHGTDLSLKGQLDSVTTLDVGVALHAAPALPAAAAYHVNVERALDDDHHFQFSLERPARAIQRRDGLTASLQLTSSF